ncbi:LysR family transcriptional regulator [Archangium violaceum]|uniref:LysR family transcriptional regulator n=1 Tax=Archangium violaceum TaxID=83451 RepID=UPI0036DBCC73
MEPLSAIEAFVRSAELGSFSAAARKLVLTPAAVSKSVARLEDSLGVRLFHRTTRKLKLTEAGEHLFADVAGSLHTLQEALTRVSSERLEPTGTLKLSLAPAFGREYVLPVLKPYREACPRVLPEWHFENRQVDLIAEGYDVAVGAGLELSAGLVARELARIHIIAVSSKEYLKKHGTPKTPEELAHHQVIAFRSPRTGKPRVWTMRNRDGTEALVDPKPAILLSELDAMAAAVRGGMGVALLPTSQVLADLERGTAVRVLPEWYADGGPLLVYFSSQRLLPARVRVFIELLAAHFKQEKLAQRFRADR